MCFKPNKKEIERLTTELNAAKQYASSLETTIDHLNNNNIKMKSSINDALAAVEAANKTIASLEDCLQKSNLQADNAVSQKMIAEQDCERMSAINIELKNQNDNYAAIIDELQTKMCNNENYIHGIAQYVRMLSANTKKWGVIKNIINILKNAGEEFDSEE